MFKEIIETYTQKVWNEKDLDFIEQVFDEKAIIHSPLGQFQSRDQMREVVVKWTDAIEGMQVETLHIMEENSVVISHWKATGQHKKAINNVPATGKAVEYSGVTIYRFSENKVVEYWAYINFSAKGS